jgi:hypothetical protein
MPPVLGSRPPTAADAELPPPPWWWLRGAEAAVDVAEGEALADEEALADAEGLAIILPPIVDPLLVALGVVLADADGLAIMLSSIICPLGIMC